MTATFSLAIGGQVDSSAESLRERQAMIESLPLRCVCRLLDADGAVLADTDAKDEKWIVSVRAGDDAKMWHKSLRDIRLKGGRVYTIELDIDGSDTIPKDLTITPVLEGGGSERL